MKRTYKLLILFSVILLGCKSAKNNLNNDNSFKGIIKFSTEITALNPVVDDTQRLLKYKYGDSLIMYYSGTGNFRRFPL